MIDDLDVARAAVRAASEAALRLRDGPLDTEVKGSATDLVTAADHAAEAAAVELVRSERPRDGVLGEEGTLISGPRHWIIDGIDGTLAFVRRLPGWGSAIALQQRGETLASAVCDPLADELFSGGGGSGSLELAWLACGRIDGWIQHAPAPWDWEPGAILVAEAGGTVIVRGAWHIAGSPQVAAELSALVV